MGRNVVAQYPCAVRDGAAMDSERVRMLPEGKRVRVWRSAAPHGGSPNAHDKAYHKAVYLLYTLYLLYSVLPTVPTPPPIRAPCGVVPGTHLAARGAAGVRAVPRALQRQQWPTQTH